MNLAGAVNVGLDGVVVGPAPIGSPIVGIDAEPSVIDRTHCRGGSKAALLADGHFFCLVIGPPGGVDGR